MLWVPAGSEHLMAFALSVQTAGLLPNRWTPAEIQGRVPGPVVDLPLEIVVRCKALWLH